MNMKWILISASLLATLSACNQNGKSTRSLKAATVAGEKTVKQDVLADAFKGIDASYSSSDLSLASQIQAVGITRGTEQQNTASPTGGINNGSPLGGLTVSIQLQASSTPIVLASTSDVSKWQTGGVYDLTLGSDSSLKETFGDALRVRATCLIGTSGICQRIGILVSAIDTSTSNSTGVVQDAQNAGFIFDGSRLERAQGSVQDLGSQQVISKPAPQVATK